MNENTRFEGSDAELSQMTSTLQDMHEDVMPKVSRTIGEMAERLKSAERTPVNRRMFLMGGLTAAGGLALAACSSSTKSASSPPSTSSSSSSTTSATLTGDLRAVGLAAALENLAVAAYTLVLNSAQAGKYGKVPPAIGTFAVTARAQHQDHAAAWNSVLQQAGKSPVTTTPLSFAGSAVTSLKGATTLTSVATQALNLENTAAQTYLAVEGTITDTGGIAIASTIAPVEAMHAAILYYVLGKYPVPNAFLGTSMAAPVSSFTG